MNNFPILIEAEESAVGSVLRILHKTPGIVGIHLKLEEVAASGATGVRQLVSPKTKTKAPPIGHGAGHRGGIRKLIASALQKAPLHWSIVKQLLTRNNYSDSSARSAITKMMEDKEIMRIAAGTYRLTAKGEKKYATLLPPHNPSGSKHNRVGLRSVILREVVQRNKAIEHGELKHYLLDSGYSDANMYNMVPKMVTEGLLVRHGDMYHLTEGGAEYLTALSEEPKVAEKPTPVLEDRSRSQNNEVTFTEIE